MIALNEYINIIVYVLAILVLILLGWNIHLSWRLKRLSHNKNGGSIEDGLKCIKSDLKELNKFQIDVEKYLEQLEKRVSRSIHGAHNISFNAFKGMDSGGRQSFATALLNEHGDGVIISTLHARDRVNVFAKEIKDFKSIRELSEEEKLALTKAKESCKL